MSSRSLMHRVFPPSEPPDGGCPQSFRLVVGGTQLRGSWYLSAIVRLQGFSSVSPTASPRRWSPKAVTTSPWVGRSKPGCDLGPALSFKDVHHPRWGGGRAEPSPTRSKVLPLRHGGLGPTRHASWPRAEEAKPPRAVHATAQRLRASLRFCPDQRAKGRAAMQAACNRAKWARPSDFQRTQHGGPGPHVMQPARRLLRASNCTATRTTTTPPRLRNQYRDSRQPCVRPSSASQARRSIRPKMGRQ